MDDLINEEFTDEFSILAEEEIRDGKKQICFRGILSEANKINRNLRIYPEAVLREACLNAIDAAKKSGQSQLKNGRKNTGYRLKLPERT